MTKLYTRLILIFCQVKNKKKYSTSIHKLNVLVNHSWFHISIFDLWKSIPNSSSFLGWNFDWRSKNFFEHNWNVIFRSKRKSTSKSIFCINKIHSKNLRAQKAINILRQKLYRIPSISHAHNLEDEKLLQQSFQVFWKLIQVFSIQG